MTIPQLKKYIPWGNSHHSQTSVPKIHIYLAIKLTLSHSTNTEHLLCTSHHSRLSGYLSEQTDKDPALLGCRPVEEITTKVIRTIQKTIRW